jgi:xanthine/uracil/vitamin C permease (AzgA family)
MVTGYIFTAFLIILGLAVMRFGSIHFKKFKEGKTKIKSRLSGQLSFLILFVIIIGLIVYSVNDLLFN